MTFILLFYAEIWDYSFRWYLNSKVYINGQWPVSYYYLPKLQTRRPAVPAMKLLQPIRIGLANHFAACSFLKRSLVFAWELVKKLKTKLLSHPTELKKSTSFNGNINALRNIGNSFYKDLWSLWPPQIAIFAASINLFLHHQQSVSIRDKVMFNYYMIRSN